MATSINIPRRKHDDNKKYKGSRTDQTYIFGAPPRKQLRSNGQNINFLLLVSGIAEDYQTTLKRLWLPLSQALGPHTGPFPDHSVLAFSLPPGSSEAATEQRLRRGYKRQSHRPCRRTREKDPAAAAGRREHGGFPYPDRRNGPVTSHDRKKLVTPVSGRESAAA